ncbi:glycoside hydrolase family 28 protein [Pedobacter sp.]|uniref:glycoside hydrolase family 28 protein n=1 Tax=Pedobacter sp. TaxID=1411316 RepID=UPI003C3D1294
MNKVKIAIMLLCFGITIAKAQVPVNIEPFSTPFGDFKFRRPVFPNKSVNITDFGARAGGKFKNTLAINNAIKKLSKAGGGKVIVSKGIWLTGPIVLLSNVNLHLEEGAELLFSQDFNDYLPAVLANFEGSEVYMYSPFIYAYKQENIAITGKGVLNGQGKPWWEQRKSPGFGNQRLIEMNENEVPLKDRLFNSLENYLPPNFFGPLNCKHILLEGVSFKYGAFWTINPSFCEDVIIRNINILTEGEYGHTPNGDGINPNSCQNVLIEYNTISTGDDCITIKSGRNKDGRRIGLPAKNTLIRHNKGLHGHGGIVIGSEMSGGVENLYAYDCEFNGTDRVIRIKTDRGRGAYIKNCWFKDISADTIQREAIRINMLYSGGNRLPQQEVTSGTPVIENINFDNISCKYAKGSVIQIIGLPEMPVNNVTFKNMNLGGKLGIDIKDAKNITLDNLTISNKVGTPASIMFSDHIVVNKLKIAETAPEKLPILLNDIHHIKMTNLKYNIDKEFVKITGKSESVEFDKTIPEEKIVKENN